MNKKFLLLVAMIFMFVASCKEPVTESTDNSTPKKTGFKELPRVESSLPPHSDTFGNYTDASLALGNLLQADVMVWPEINAKYKALRPLIGWIDTTNRTTYSKEIQKALAEIGANNKVEVNRHVVTKGLQHVSVLIISDLMDKTITGDAPSAVKTAASIETIFAAIKPTFARRDATVYDGKATLVPAAQQALAALKSAKSKVALAGAVMNFSALLSKTYALSVLFEMKGVEEFCAGPGAEPGKCEIKRTEARIYYRIISKSVEAQDKQANAEIEKMINSERAVPKYESARDLLAKSLPFTVEDLTF